MKDLILEKLQTLEAHENVRVLYACESGSRAWGLESPDSDWDVRFIYVHPRDHYLGLRPLEDTIERTDGDLDIVGWDLRKTLLLASKSNPALLEWLCSPAYMRDQKFTDCLSDILRDYDAHALAHHYAGLALKTYRIYWKFPGEHVKLKKYAYVLRPLLCLRYMQYADAAIPFVDFDRLMRYVDMPDRVRSEMGDWAHEKRRNGEQMTNSDLRFPAMEAYMIREIADARERASAVPVGRSPNMAALNTLFLNTLGVLADD